MSKSKPGDASERECVAQTAHTDPPTKVNIYCTHCHAQIGICNNDWVRLTGSYARPRDKGIEFATRVGENVRVVPEAAVHKLAAGCHMADVQCESCNTSIGQYCKDAPEVTRSQTIGHQFYKLSRIHLKDARTSVDVQPAIQEPTDSTTASVLSTPLIKPKAVTPLPMGRMSPPPRPPSTLNAIPHMPAPAQVGPLQPDMSYVHGINPAPGQNDMLARLAQLEQRLGTTDLHSLPQSSRLDSALPMPHGMNFSPSMCAQHQQLVEDRDKQILAMTAQIDDLRRTIEDLRNTVHDQREEKIRLQSSSQEDKASTIYKTLEDMMNSVRSNQATSVDTKKLRAENKLLKHKLLSIHGALDSPELDGDEALKPSDDSRGLRISLGKRKREDADFDFDLWRSSDAVNGREDSAPRRGDGSHGLPTPDSIPMWHDMRAPTASLQQLPRPAYYNDCSFPPAPHPSMYYGHAPPGVYSQPGLAYHDLVPTVQRPQSRAGPATGSAKQSPSERDTRAKAADGAGAEHVEFSDDEITMSNQPDAPLSNPRRRARAPIYRPGSPSAHATYQPEYTRPGGLAPGHQPHMQSDAASVTARTYTPDEIPEQQQKKDSGGQPSHSTPLSAKRVARPSLGKHVPPKTKNPPIVKLDPRDRSSPEPLSEVTNVRNEEPAKDVSLEAEEENAGSIPPKTKTSKRKRTSGSLRGRPRKESRGISQTMRDT
jgi:hypothetical protein